MKRFLRSSSVIVGEIVAVALAGVLGASLPQADASSAGSLARLSESGSWWAALVKVLALDHVFRSTWFLALTLLSAASLGIVLAGQVRRLRKAWTQRPTPAHFRSAPFQAEFERPASQGAGEPRVEVWTEKRLGLAGSVMLHAGLLLVILAGALRALFGTEAMVDLIEGETLPPTAAAWAAQFPGVLGQPFHLDGSVTLNSVKAVRYSNGELRDLGVELAVQGRSGVEATGLAVNHDFKAGGRRVFLGSDFGPAALLEWQSPETSSRREATLLTRQGQGEYEGTSPGPNGLCAFLRARVGADGGHPKLAEVRVMKDGALLFNGEARVGQTAVLPGGGRLILHGLPFWARLRGSRDAALGLAYAGFALLLAGVVLIFTLVKVDGCVVVTPAGARERVWVALKPQRFAPLYAERFQELVRSQGGPAASEEPMTTEAKPRRAAKSAPTVREFQPACRMPAARPWAAAVGSVAVRLWLGGCLLFLVGCQRSSLDQARLLVEGYNRVVAEAYRRGDVKLIDPVVGPNEGRKITGLIGVRLDLGLTLDAQLLSLEVRSVEQAKDELRVQTKERWRYRDRKIGTGAQVGQDSLDSYEMLYVFKKIDRAWRVDELRFTTAPQVGRQQTTWAMERKSGPGAVRTTQEPEVCKP